MNRSKHFTTLAAVFLAATAISNAQVEDFRWGAGILGGGTIAVTEGDDINPSWGVRGFVRYALVSSLQLELGAGYLNYQDKQKDFAHLEVEGSAIPIDLRLDFTPFPYTRINPYLFTGIGMMVYDAEKAGTILSPFNDHGETSGSYLFIPVGLGTKFQLSHNWAIDVQVGNNLGLDDVLNPNLDGTNDGLWHGMVGIAYAFGSDPDRDSDGDLLTDKYEKGIGTNPKIADTDGDGLNDGMEVNTHNTDPLVVDTDGDGLGDGDEVNRYGTKPTKADTDGDSLSDGDEVNKHKTNPLEKDSDKDNLSDGDEVLTHKTNPLVGDTDNDLLNDGDEVNRYKTDPLKADSDGDALQDGAEVLTHKTDPLKVDTDGDGLADGVEVNTHKTRPDERDTDKDGLSDGDEVNRYRTNPNLGDTDLGGIPDGSEVARGINPLDKNDDVTVKEVVIERERILEKDKPLVLKGIVFETGKADIKPESEGTLREVLQSLEANPEVQVEIGGHTDNVGNDQNNMTLSLNRANSVKAWLVANGVAADRIQTKGYGETTPSASNDTPEGRQQNRRIEMKRTN